MLTSASSPISQKTSIGLGNLHVSDRYQKDLKGENSGPGPLHLLSSAIWKDKSKDILALLDSGSKVNAMTPAYTAWLGLNVQKTDIGAQKIDKSTLATYGMVIAAFQVLNKLGRLQFF